MNAGEASFTVKKENYSARQTYHFIGTGNTYKNYDWFYKVRDRFDTWADTATLKPYRYIRNTKEGGNNVYNDSYFNYKEKEVKCYSIAKGKVQTDSAGIKPCTFDVLSMIYYSRCIDYTGMKYNAKVPISIYLDGQIYDTLYIRYLGKEKIKTENGDIECIKFSPLLIKGTIFSGGEGMTVWVSNDEKKVPLLITTPIIVGEIQVKRKQKSSAK